MYASVASKLLISTVKTSYKIKVPNFTTIRSYRDVGRKFGQGRTKVEEVQQAFISKSGLKSKIGPLEVGQIAVAGSAAVGLGALCYYGLGLSNQPGVVERMYIWPEYVKQRVQDTYLYFGASVGAVAASAVAIYRSPVGHRFFHWCNKHPIMATVGIFAALIGSGQVMMAIPYAPGIGTKQMMWLVNCGILGLAIAPVASLGGAIVVRAAWYTAGIIGGLSTVAVCAPSEKFLNMAGPLGIGLGGVIIATLGSAFIPPTGTLGLSLYSISLYGGLILFSALLLYDTQKVMKTAERHPSPSTYGIRPFDPINASHRIVMDAVNIFVRIAQVLAMGGGRK